MPAFVSDFYKPAEAANTVALQDQQIKQNQAMMPLLAEQQRLKLEQTKTEVENQRTFTSRLAEIAAKQDTGTDMNKSPMSQLKASANFNAGAAKLAWASGMFDDARKLGDAARKDAEDLVKLQAKTQDNIAKQFSGVYSQASLDATLDQIRQEDPESYRNILAKYPGITRFDGNGQRAIQELTSSSMGAYKEATLLDKKNNTELRRQALIERAREDRVRDSLGAAKLAQGREHIGISRERLALSKATVGTKINPQERDINAIITATNNSVDRINNNVMLRPEEKAANLQTAVGTRHGAALEKIKKLPDYTQRIQKAKELALPLPSDPKQLVKGAVYRLGDRVEVYQGPGKHADVSTLLR